jgi:isoleucyl-tRNA synthetase
LPFPEAREDLFDEDIERRMSRMQKVIELARTARERCGIGLKIPLLTLVVLADPSYLEDIRSLEDHVREELNVRKLTLTSDEEQYNVRLRAIADWPRLGKKLKKDAQVVRKALPGLTNEDLRKFLSEKSITVAGIFLDEDDLTVVRGVGEQESDELLSTDGPKWEPSSDSDVIVLLDSMLYPELMDEGLARELINRIQKLRKKAGLVPTDDVRMEYHILKNPEAVDIDGILTTHEELIRSAVRGRLEQSAPADSSDANLIVEEIQEINSLVLSLRILRL